jgi:CHAT domain-containing protein
MRRPARAVLLLVAAGGLAILARHSAVRAPDTDAVSVETIVREAENLAHVEAFEPARTALEAALRTARSRADPRLEALCLDRIGLVFHFAGRPADGRDAQRRALEIARRIGDDRLAASILASVGITHWRHAEYVQATELLGEGLAIQERLGDEAGRARTLLFIGRVHFKKAEYAQARERYLQAAAVFAVLPDRRGLSIAFEDLADAALEQGRFVEALENYERALDWRRRDGDAKGEAYMLTMVGKAYLLQESYRHAATWFERAVAFSRQHDDRAALALALYHQGTARAGLGDPAGALETYTEALALKLEVGDRRQQAWILRRMGDVHVAEGRVASALESYDRANQIFEEIGDPRGLAGGLSRAAQLNFQLGRYHASVDAFRRAGELVVAGQPAFHADALAGMGRAYAAAGDAGRALEHGRRAMAAARGAPDHVRWSAARSMGWIQRRLGYVDAALASYRESLAVIEAIRARTVADADVRADFLEAKQVVYAETVDALFELGRVEEAFEVAERSRTRAFLDMLQGRALAARPSPAPLTLAGARREARRTGGAILEYFCSDNRLFMWVIDARGGVHAASVAISQRELGDLTGALRRAMAADQAVDSRPLLRRLHHTLIDPVASRLPRDPNRLLTIVPHGPLFLLSFAALLDDRGTYLVERHTLAYSPSLSVLPYTNANRARAIRTGAAPILIVGNPAMPHPPGETAPLPPLPGAEREARAIASVYRSSQVRVLTGADASEAAFRHLAGSHAIIHLATHASIRDDAPMRSYLALARDATAVSAASDPLVDGLLTVGDVFTLDLRAGLVTLSACDTGLGQVSGEGVVGLSRAFIYAGAASVLVSLWRVADVVASTEMQLFYSEAARTGGNKAAALARAQRQMIAMLRAGAVDAGGRRLPEDPLFWAAFVLVGEAA